MNRPDIEKIREKYDRILEALGVRNGYEEEIVALCNYAKEVECEKEQALRALDMAHAAQESCVQATLRHEKMVSVESERANVAEVERDEVTRLLRRLYSVCMLESGISTSLSEPIATVLRAADERKENVAEPPTGTR